MLCRPMTLSPLPGLFRGCCEMDRGERRWAGAAGAGLKRTPRVTQSLRDTRPTLELIRDERVENRCAGAGRRSPRDGGRSRPRATAGAGSFFTSLPPPTRSCTSPTWLRSGGRANNSYPAEFMDWNLMMEASAQCMTPTLQ